MQSLETSYKITQLCVTGGPALFFFKYLFYSFEMQSERERGRNIEIEKETFYLLVHIPNGYNSLEASPSSHLSNK